MKRTIFRIVGLFANFLFLCLVVVETPAAPLTIPRGKIAFTSDRDGNSEIYLMNADGTNQIRLTNNSVRDDYPTWSPDGRKIAYLTLNDGIYSINLMNADGKDQTGLVKLTLNSNQSYPSERFGMSWSPDGKSIVYQDLTDIFTINIDASDKTNLTGGQFTNSEPTWSPTGKEIAFARSVYDHGFYTNIYTMEGNGANVTKVTTSPAYSEGRSPDWSSNGGLIVMAAGSDIADDDGLALINPDGTKQQFLLGVPIHTPKWSPDGKKIVFYRSASASQIWVIDSNGTRLTQLTTTSPNNFHPSWQPLLFSKLWNAT